MQYRPDGKAWAEPSSLCRCTLCNYWLVLYVEGEPSPVAVCSKCGLRESLSYLKGA